MVVNCKNGEVSNLLILVKVLYPPPLKLNDEVNGFTRYPAPKCPIWYIFKDEKYSADTRIIQVTFETMSKSTDQMAMSEFQNQL